MSVRACVTGHSNLTAASHEPIRAALRTTLTGFPDPVGVSCLARGADQVFARAVLDLDARLEVVLPSQDYRAMKVKPENRAEFEELLAAASAVTTLPYAHAGREAYAAAAEHLLATGDTLVAVWDGQPPDGRGGTGDTVEIARARGLPVTVVWPEGAARAEPTAS